MLQVTALMLNVVQRILEYNLLEGVRIIIQRNCWLEGFKIKKIQRIRKVTQKRLYALLINVRGMIEQLMLNLHLLSGGQSAEFVDSIEGNDARVIVRQLR